MKPITKQSDKKAAFTIVELLTVMSIIIILISLLVPSLNMVKRYAKGVRQKAQFHSIDSAMELFNNEWDGYPPSDAEDEVNQEYCGAMKLCEAMVGQDLLGFHPNSRFRSDGDNGSGKNLYDENDWTAQEWSENLKARRGPYLPLEGANAYRLRNLYSNAAPTFDEDLFVLCDVYKRVTPRITGPEDAELKEKIGMPILYYKADTSGVQHDPNDLPTPGDNKGQIYNYLDNDELVKLKKPLDGSDHPLENEPERFYEMTKNNKITIDAGRPYRSDSYILLSAGFDGEYGTPDDIFNFEK